MKIIHSKKNINNFASIKKWFCLWLLLLLPGFSSAQELYYFHTIHSHGLSVAGGRTARLNYTYQVSHLRQLKISGIYIYDAYNQGRNRIKSNIFNADVQFQFHLVNKSQAFLNFAIGGGGYYLTSKDVLSIKHKEWRVNFAAGLQAELYIVRNTLALTVDYDFLYMPWSKIYEFMHIPTAGITFYLF